MLDITLLRRDLNSVIARLENRKNPQAFLNVNAYQALETERKTLQTRTEELQASRNTLSKQIGQLKAKGESADAVMAQVADIKTELDTSAVRLDALQAELQTLLLAVPNLPHESVPVGSDEHGNKNCAVGAPQAKTLRPWRSPRAIMWTWVNLWALTVKLA